MSEELERNRTRLKLGENPPPYFISYAVKDLTQAYVAARYGALFDDSTNRDRRVFADVRVGSHELDNSINEELDFNFSLKGTSYTTRKEAPLDDDLTALRTALWLITDEKYKGGLFNLLKKKGEAVYVVDDPKKPPSLQPRAAEHLRRPRGQLHLRPGAVDGAGAQGVGPVQRGGEDLRHRRAGHRRQGGPLLRQLRGLAHRHRAGLLRGPPLRGDPGRRRAAARRLARLLRVPRGGAADRRRG